MRRVAIGTLAVCIALLGFVRAVATQERQPAAPADTPDLVARFLASTGPALTSYRAFRTLEAEARGGHTRGRLTAWTTLDPVKGFDYSVVEETGSGVICRKVLRAALEAERSMRANGEIDKGALTPRNYEFKAASAADSGLVRVGIHPRRSDTTLIDGSILLTDPDGDLVRVEGALVKRPSFWTREVQVERRYDRICGVRVPVSMHSTARVLVVGRSTFSMTYDYASINGLLVAKGGLR